MKPAYKATAYGLMDEIDCMLERLDILRGRQRATERQQLRRCPAQLRNSKQGAADLLDQAAAHMREARAALLDASWR